MQELTDNPLVAFLLIGFLVASLAIWSRVFSRLSHRQQLLPAGPRREVPWRGIHVGVAFLVYIVLPQSAFLLARWRFDLASISKEDLKNPEIIVLLMAAQSVLFLLAMALIATYLRIDLAVDRSDLGYSAREIGKDLVLGVCAFVAIAPPVFALQSFLVLVYRQWYDGPALHPIIETIMDQPTPSILIWSTISAVLVAPLVEEFLFRVVLQGWLERVGRGTRLAIQILRQNERRLENPMDDANEENPYAAPSVTSDAGHPVQRTESTPERLMPAPILISAMLFAVFHLGQGPAPIPLFLLALVLGYLYQKTHRILPSLVVHFLLNGTTMLVLWMGYA